VGDQAGQWHRWMRSSRRLTVSSGVPNTLLEYAVQAMTGRRGRGGQGDGAHPGRRALGDTGQVEQRTFLGRGAEYRYSRRQRQGLRSLRSTACWRRSAPARARGMSEEARREQEEMRGPLRHGARGRSGWLERPCEMRTYSHKQISCRLFNRAGARLFFYNSKEKRIWLRLESSPD